MKEKGKWSFGNDYARNAAIFGVDNGKSFHAGNVKNIFLVLDAEENFGINGSFCAPKKGLVLISVKQTQNFA